MKLLIFNTSSSLYLTKVGLIPKLLKHFKIIATTDIEKEMKEGVERGYKDAQMIVRYFEEEKIKVVQARKSKEISKDFNIKEIDASVIALAQEQKGIVATEDRQIEKICLMTGTPVINTAVLIYILWKEQELNAEQSYLLLELLLRQGYNKEICLKMKEKIMQEE